jgi:hypothetical protein
MGWVLGSELLLALSYELRTKEAGCFGGDLRLRRDALCSSRLLSG